MRADLLSDHIPATDRTPARPKSPATEAQIDTALWLLATARTLGLTTFGAIGQLVKLDGSVISRYLRGRYEADLASLTARIERFREDWNAQQRLGDMPFVAELSVVRKIAQFAEMTRLTRQMSRLWGNSQTGKTWALEHVAADPAKDTIFWPLAESGREGESIDALATACGVPLGKSSAEKRERIRRRITPQTLLIVDEFHEAFIGRSLKMGLIEFIRRTKDLCGCGVLLCGTHVFVEMLASPKFADFLAQTRRRGVLEMEVPTAPEPGDLALLYTAYRLPEPEGRAAEFTKKISAADGIGTLTKWFQVARMLAMNDRAELTWEHFTKTIDTFATLGGKGK